MILYLLLIKKITFDDFPLNITRGRKLDENILKRQSEGIKNFFFKVLDLLQTNGIEL